MWVTVCKYRMLIRGHVRFCHLHSSNMSGTWMGLWTVYHIVIISTTNKYCTWESEFFFVKKHLFPYRDPPNVPIRSKLSDIDTHRHSHTQFDKIHCPNTLYWVYNFKKPAWALHLCVWLSDWLSDTLQSELINIILHWPIWNTHLWPLTLHCWSMSNFSKGRGQKQPWFHYLLIPLCLNGEKQDERAYYRKLEACDSSDLNFSNILNVFSHSVNHTLCNFDQQEYNIPQYSSQLPDLH